MGLLDSEGETEKRCNGWSSLTHIHTHTQLFMKIPHMNSNSEKDLPVFEAEVESSLINNSLLCFSV